MTEYVTAAMIAERLGAHVSTVWRRVQEGRLPLPVYVGSRSPRWNWAEIETALEARRMRPAEAAARRRRARAAASAAE